MQNSTNPLCAPSFLTPFNWLRHWHICSLGSSPIINLLAIYVHKWYICLLMSALVIFLFTSDISVIVLHLFTSVFEGGYNFNMWVLPVTELCLTLLVPHFYLLTAGRLLTALISEYLDWAQLSHTLKVYQPECNLVSTCSPVLLPFILANDHIVCFSHILIFLIMGLYWSAL